MPRPLGGRDHVVRRSPRDGHGARRRSRSFELRNAATLDGGAICTALGSYPQRATSGECTPIAPRDEEALRRRIQLAVSIPKHLAAFALNVLGTLPDGGSLCHGDFHPGNLLLGSAGPFVIDWTGATRGDPDGDVARTLFLLRSGEPVPGTRAPMRAVIAVGRGAFAALYRKSYSSRRRVNGASIERWSIPHVAARFAEGIEEETEGLIRWLELRYAQR